jgi:hypothetical protein
MPVCTQLSSESLNAVLELSQQEEVLGKTSSNGCQKKMGRVHMASRQHLDILQRHTKREKQTRRGGCIHSPRPGDEPTQILLDRYEDLPRKETEDHIS